MKKLVGAVASALLAATTATAQGLPQLYTHPAVPPEEALNRLNLQLAWRVYVPTEGRRDGLFSVQVLDKQILAQTRSGTVIALDVATGATQWRMRAGAPYLVVLPLCSNAQSVFVVNGTRLFALQRSTGRPQWDLTLPGAPTAPLAADDGYVYVPLGSGRLTAYELPKPGPVPSGAGSAAPSPGSGSRSSAVSPLSRSVAPTQPSGQAEAAGLAPQRAWEYPGGSRIEQAPLVFQDFVVVATSDGSLINLSRNEGRVLYRLPSDNPVMAPLGQHGGMAYAVSRDFNVSALDISLGKILWRVTTGTLMLRKPEVTDEDVYVAAERLGLTRIKRLTGETVWRQATADRFLAANGKFVYATDRSGQLLILDRARGTQLAGYDTRNFVVPVSNEWTDRLFLAGNDGLLICLHDRAYRTPLRTKTTEEQPKPATGKPEEKQLER